MENKKEVLRFVAQAGHTLLENGAEISRVEETMDRISAHYGVEDSDFFVLSNGIFTTGESFAKAEYIPIRSSRLDKVVEVNQLSRDIVSQNLSLSQASLRLQAIKEKSARPLPIRLMAAMFGCSAFTIIFGGSVTDALAVFIVALLLDLFIIGICDKLFAKTLGSVLGGIVGTFLCMLFHKLGLGDNLPNMIVGTMILLIPGVAFTNGLRDISGEDYLAGGTRLMDALMVFFCIALGVSLSFVLHRNFSGEPIVLHGMETDSLTSHVLFQVAASFVGTVFFSLLFGAPSRNCIPCGVVGMLGWLSYLLCVRYTGWGVVFATFVAAALVAVCSRAAARLQKCPEIVYLVCGIFPLIPGAGVFWGSYYLVSGQFYEAISSGFMSVKITIAIVFGILVADNILWRRSRSFTTK